METHHQLIIGDAAAMKALDDKCVDLVVTSPPYPMIEMWDALFEGCNRKIGQALKTNDTGAAFELMHAVLDAVWREVHRVVKPGGVVCINIGDATRTIDGRFRLYANHARIIATFIALGFDQLPAVIWRKPTNAPNKFMGSGMLPPSAYVTLEHEYILIFRKGAKREFNRPKEKARRRQSAYFWEERNAWFSDVWYDLVGTPQSMKRNGARDRSAAFPFELPYRLIHMFSIQGDMVLDPFLGTGTTMLAAMATGRCSTGYEIEPAFKTSLLQQLPDLPAMANEMVERRLARHTEFVRERRQRKGDLKHHNHVYDMPVITRQEVDLFLAPVRAIQLADDDCFKVVLAPPGPSIPAEKERNENATAETTLRKPAKGHQLKMF
ncbi:MAG: site-specific DNA-methyltransferase [Desulfatitalea sp.]|nr:site-specific DNA-methyltransferase [Desulfatitalea sp.]NNK00006.1 site-specific DNA-methyltransferase [Desulfatitalea sp.]